MMSAATFPKRQVLTGAFFLLCMAFACLINADIAFASEQYVVASDGGATLRNLTADIFIGLVFLAILPAALFLLSLPTQWKLEALPMWKVKGEMAKAIRPTKDTRKRLLIISLITFGVASTGPIFGPIPARIGLFESNLPSFIMVGIIIIIAIIFFSAAAVTQGAYVLVFPDGKIWYKTHMKLRYRSFNVSDIEFVEEHTIGKFNFSTFYLKEGTHTRLFWLFFPPKFREYLVEQEVHIVTKDEKKDSHE